MPRRFGSSITVPGNASANLELVPKQQLDAAIAAVGITAPSVKTANYTLTDSDNVVIFDCAAAIRTCTLPTAVGRAGKIFTVKKKGPVDSNLVQMATTSSETIDGGAASLTVLINTEAIRFISDGTNWHTIGGQRPFTAFYTSPANGGSITLEAPSQSLARINTTVAGFTLNVPTNGIEGVALNVEIQPTNAFALTLHASILLMSGLSATVNAGAGKRMFIGLRYANSNWYCLAQGVQA